MASPIRWLAVPALAFGAFIVFASSIKEVPRPNEVVLVDRVVVSAPVQVILYGGDRFLAADVEAIRASVTAMDVGAINIRYLVRAQNVASELNPCHEDNYYTANALLAWVGGDREAGTILDRAIRCRFWDEMPAFYLGFNQYFFQRSYSEAQQNINLAAARARDGVASLRNLAIVIQAESLQDERKALEFLIDEKNRTNDKRLRKLLELRAGRIAGLLTLRDAQKTYESRFRKKLQSPESLITMGILSEFPSDPMRFGYRFSDGVFVLNEPASR